MSCVEVNSKYALQKGFRETGKGYYKGREGKEEKSISITKSTEYRQYI